MTLIKSIKVYPFHLVAAAGMVAVVASPGYAVVYLTIEQAQQEIFPGEKFTATTLNLTEADEKIIKEKLGITQAFSNSKIWRSDQNNYFFVDQVIGKHELITYAVGINADGSVRQVEIMEYREAYGHEIRQKRWRRQFSGKTVYSPLELNTDIQNISGATLSCRHVTEGVKRLVNLYEHMFKQ